MGHPGSGSATSRMENTIQRISFFPYLVPHFRLKEQIDKQLNFKMLQFIYMKGSFVCEITMVR